MTPHRYEERSTPPWTQKKKTYENKGKNENRDGENAAGKFKHSRYPEAPTRARRGTLHAQTRRKEEMTSMKKCANTRKKKEYLKNKLPNVTSKKE